MPPINLLIKPASGNCNMRCRYCFYCDVAKNRQTASYGMMEEETLEAVIEKALAHTERECTFAFQGGEPTLAGLPFFEKVVALEQKHNRKKVAVHNALQTNGLVIDESWAQFLHDHHFLVGLSLDGTKELHDLNRMDAQGKGTFTRVLRTAQLFDRFAVEYNILTVVTEQVARKIAGIYGFYKKNRFRYLQFIPCLDPLGVLQGQGEGSLTVAGYTYFLKTLFDLWSHDLAWGEFVYIRSFENLVSMLLGFPPESCSQSGRCGHQYVVEADGGVYPCDFYVLDQYRLGSFLENSFAELEQKRRQLGFIELSCQVHEDCRACKYFSLCRGECRRNREPVVDGVLSKNYFCESFYAFFEYAMPRLQQIAAQAAQNLRRQGL